MKVWTIMLALGGCVAAATGQAQGYGQTGSVTGGAGGYGGQGGASIARVAVAPNGFGGGTAGVGAGQGGFAGGTQGFGGSGGGGLHGVTRRTFMAEPNMVAAQYFSLGGVNVAPASGFAAGTAGTSFYGAGSPAGAPNGRLAIRTRESRWPQRGTVGTQTAANAAARSRRASALPGAMTSASAGAAPEPGLSAAQMAGVTPSVPTTDDASARR